MGFENLASTLAGGTIAQRTITDLVNKRAAQVGDTVTSVRESVGNLTSVVGSGIPRINDSIGGIVSNTVQSANNFMGSITRDLPTSFDPNRIYDLGGLGVDPDGSGSRAIASGEAARLLDDITGRVNGFSGIPVQIDAPTAGNSFSHESESVPEALNQSGIKLDFLPNILDNTDVITYHWKLFMVDMESARNGNVWDPAGQIIIAESGVTEIAIDNVVINSIATPTVETGTGTSTEVSFTLREPAGAGLLDKLLVQAIGLGVGNWTGMPYYLQLQFRGRDPDTGLPYDSANSNLGGLTWLWMIRMKNMGVNVTTVGTVYDCSAIMYNEYAQTNVNFTVQHNVRLENLTTVASAMSELQDKINFDQVIKLLGNYSVPDVFEIKVDPEIAGEPVTPPDSTRNSVRSNSMDKMDLKEASFNAGTGIDKIIDSILAQTQKYQTSMLNAPTPGQDGAPADTVKSQMRKFWRIVTETRPIRFDPKRNDDAKHYTIYVISYDIGVLDSNTLQTSDTVSTTSEKKRLKRYADGGILRKKYNYIFTGLNDQVRNFDLNLNHAFAAASARMSGVYSNVASSSKGRVNQENAARELELSSKISRALAFQNNASRKSARESAAAIESARTAIDAAQLDDETKSRYYSVLEYSKRQDRTALTKELAGVGVNSPGVNLTGSVRNQFFSTPKRDLITGEQYRFLSDVDPTDTETAAKFREHIGKMRPIPFVEMSQDHQVGQGVEADPNSGIQKLSSMFAVALNSSLDSSMTQVSLEIKGDPYWLFPQPYVGRTRSLYVSDFESDMEKFRWLKAAHKTKFTDSVNMFGTDNFILIRFRTPRIDMTDGEGKKTDPYTDVNLFSGIYKVTTVVSTFSDGVFKQDLKCIIDPEINVMNFTRELEDAVRAPDIPLTVDRLVDRTVISETAVATERLGSAVNELVEKAQTTVSQLNQGLAGVSGQLNESIRALGESPGIVNSITSNPLIFRRLA